MPLKSEKLGVWQLALDYIDLVCEIAGELPRSNVIGTRFRLRTSRRNLVA